MNKKSTYISIITIAFLLLTFSSCLSKTVENKKLTPHEMIKNNQTKEVRAEFAIPNDINGLDGERNTVLHLAAEINDSELCAYFLFRGADASLKNEYGNTPLHVAINNNAIEAAKVLCELGNVLFDRDGNGITAIDLGLQADSVYYDIFINEKTAKFTDENGQNLVHYFVKTRNLRGVKECIKKGFPLSIVDNNGKTPLDLAFANINSEDSVEIAAELIIAGADEVKTEYSYFQDAISARNVNSRFNDGQTPLHISSILGHNAIAKYLLENNADTSVQDSSGATPLHEAVRYGNLEIVRYLLSSSANVNAKDNLGKTPIMLIIPKEKIRETYSLLISHRADLLQNDMFGDTVLHTATMLNVDESSLSLLINNGADIDARNKEGVTPLTIAVQKGDIKMVTLLTSSGANIHNQDTNGSSPLSWALEGSMEMFKAIINEKNVNSQDSEGNTPLHIALLTDASLEKIKYIISLSDDVNIRNRDGNSTLFISILKNRREVGEFLLSKGADIFSTNTNNNSPLRLALKYGGEIQNWLITSKTINATDGSGNSVLHYAAEWQYEDAIQSLLDKGADINARNANGETPLFNATKTNNPSIIQSVINAGADIHARDNLGSTVIHTAVRWDASLSIDKLVDLGVNINAQNTAGKSALSEAIVSAKHDIAKQLLVYGANPNSCDSNGVSVLMDSIRILDAYSVQMLLKYGANPSMQEVNGRNAYHEAAFTGDIDIIKLIRNAGGNPLARDKNGNTPFSLVLGREFDVIKEVLGKSLNITDSDGNTPIHIVVKYSGECKLIDPNALLSDLINMGYPIDIRNSDGYTALNYAIEVEDVIKAKILLEHGANPFQMINKKGKNGVSIALEKNNKEMINNLMNYAAKMTDVQGNTLLHYAAKTSSVEVIKKIIDSGFVDKSIKNVSGDTAYTIAIRWKRPEVAALLK